MNYRLNRKTVHSVDSDGWCYGCFHKRKDAVKAAEELKARLLKEASETGRNVEYVEVTKWKPGELGYEEGSQWVFAHGALHEPWCSMPVYSYEQIKWAF